MAGQDKKRSFLKTLRGRLTLQMLAVSLIPILVIGGIVYYNMANSEKDARDKVDQTRGVLQEDVIGANLISTTSGFLGQIFPPQAATAWRLADDAVIVQAAGSGSTSNPTADEFLRKQLELTQFYYAIIIDNNGNVISGAYRSPSGVNTAGTAGLPTNPVNTQAKASALLNSVAVGEPTYHPSTTFMQIDFAARVENAQGTSIGVLQCSMMGPATLIAQMFTGNIEGCKVLMFDNQTGNLLIDTSDLTRHTQQSPELTDLERTVRDAIKGTTQNSGYFAMGGNVAVFLRLSSAVVPIYPEGFLAAYVKGCSWSLMVQQPEDVAFAGLQPVEQLKSDLDNSTNTMVITLGVILLIVLALALVASFFLSQSITKPVTELRDAAERVSTGDISVSVPEGRDDEIGDLADSFERMVASMRFLYEEEEEKKRKGEKP